MEDNLAELYKKYSNDTNNILEEDDIAPVFAPKEDSSIEDIDLSAPKNSNFDAETPLVEHLHYFLKVNCPQRVWKQIVQYRYL